MAKYTMECESCGVFEFETWNDAWEWTNNHHTNHSVTLVSKNESDSETEKYIKENVRGGSL